MDSKINKENVSGDLPTILQNEVYRSIEDRRNIKGYKKLPIYDDSRTAVYKNKRDKIIQIGLRGTSLTSLTDFLNDGELALDAGLPFLPEQVHIKKRLDKDVNLYKRIRKQYPNYKLVFAGHSLGAVSVKNILDTNQDDKNIEGHLFNHWIFNNNKIKLKNDSRIFNNDSEDLLKAPIKAGIAGSGTIAGAASYYYGRKMKQQMATNEFQNIRRQAAGRDITELNRVFSRQYSAGLPDAPSPRPLLNRQGSGILSNENNDLDLDYDIDALFGGRQFNPFVIDEASAEAAATAEERGEFGDRVNALAGSDEALEEEALQLFREKATTSGYGAGAAGLAYFLYKIKKYHSSGNFEPKNKKLLIKN